jgi:hypothetical protein
MGVSAIPFLLPVMFQIGFGYDAFDAGLMMMTVFAGNLVMKPMTTSVLRRFGFRPELVVNGLINAAAIAACAAIAEQCRCLSLARSYSWAACRARCSSRR